MAHVFLSLGSNIEREHNLQRGLIRLQQLFGEMELSSLYESDAVGFNGSPFFNMVVGIDTELTIAELSDTLRAIEYDHGRQLDAKKFSPRTLDIDILLFDDVIADSPVQIPRKEIAYNAFVLWPLAEIAGTTLHPQTKQSFAQMWQSFDRSSQQIEQLPLPWLINGSNHHDHT